jgi:predicted nucleic acid-binding protein
VTAVDTSVAVAGFASWHEDHEVALKTLLPGVRLIGHVALETYAVLTRLPPPHRAPAPLVMEFLSRNFAAPLLVLSARDHGRLLSALASAGLTGGATYDALVGATALRAGETLVTLDRRALSTYELVGATAHLLSTQPKKGGR